MAVALRPRSDLLYETAELWPGPADWYSPFIETRDAYRVLVRAAGWGEDPGPLYQHFGIEESLDDAGLQLVAWHRAPIEQNSVAYWVVNYLFTPAGRYFRLEIANPVEDMNITLSVRAVPGSGFSGMG